MADIQLLYKALSKYGIEPPKQLKSDGFTRWGNSARFWARDIGDGFLFGDFVDGLSEYIFEQSEKPLTDAEKQARAEKIKTAREQAEKEQAERWTQTAQKAVEIWQSLPPAGNHLYLSKKQIQAHGAKIGNYSDTLCNCIVLPLYDTTGKIWSLQYISENGDKRFLSGGKKKGCYFPIGTLKNNKIIVCEGFATGASINEATGQAVAIAFDKGNLEPVIKALLLKYPTFEICIGADNDIKENAPNVGKDEAERIAKLYNLTVYIPQLKSGCKCDFNDLAVAEGLQAVKDVFDGNGETLINDSLTPSERRENQQNDTTAQNQNEIPSGYFLNESGLYKMAMDTDTPPTRISDKIEVLAEARNIQGKNWSKLVRFKDGDSNEKLILLENRLFAGDSKELCSILFDNGLHIDRPPLLKTYLNAYRTQKRARCVDKTGWYNNNSFILPDETIGENTDGDDFIYFQNENVVNEYQTSGTLKQWRDNVCKYCQDNSRLTLAVCAGLASPLLNIVDLGLSGFHFIGDSSIGKSTLLKVACSIYGGREFMKQWRATDNGLEGIASNRNDTLLILDEMGQVDPNKAGEIIYMLGNGDGKIRSNRNGNARKSYSWRCLYLSSGEKGLEDCASESKKKVKAGQNIRLLNIQAKPNEKAHGVFECLHDKANGKELSEYLSAQARQFYGTSARAFIKSVIQEGFNEIGNQYIAYSKELAREILPDNAGSQVKRAFNWFAVCGFAGEYATANNLTGWQEGNATQAITTCFNDWIALRGGVESQEKTALLAQVKAFFEQYSETAFIDINSDKDKANYNGFAGYKEQTLDDVKYYVTATALRNTICAGFNFKQAREILFAIGWLKDITTDSRKIKGTTRRLYVFNSKMFESE